MAASAAVLRAPTFDFVRRAGISILFAVAIVAGAVAGVLLAFENDLPQVSSLEQFQPNIITKIYAADGALIGDFAIEKRVIVGFKDIPPVLRNAVVAVEDADFWKHLGINLWRIPSAAISNIRSGRRSQGSSTLTMQLSRVLFLTPEKTYERKVKEAILAFQIEKNFTKEEIFTLYCNQVYFGNGNYGVEAASQALYSKSIKDLTLPEAALIAGLPQNPSRLSPLESPERATQRRNHVIQRMLEEKYVSPEEAARAQAEPLNLHPRKDPPSIAPHFIEEVRKYLEREYGSQQIYQGGLQVYTTLDRGMQEAATRALRQGLRNLDRKARGFVPSPVSVLKDGAFPKRIHLDEWDRPIREGDVVRGVVLDSDRALAVVQIGDYRARVTLEDLAWTKRAVSDALPRGTVAPFAIVSLSEEGGRKEARVTLEQEPKLEGALLALEPKSGAVRAMVGGYDFERSKFNRATQAFRQVGSAFKPILYSAALERAGFTPATIIVDAPISFPSEPGKIWSPHNYDYKFLGPIPLRYAVEQSRNIPAIKTLQTVGIETGIEYGRKFGLTAELPPYLPIAIGAGEATLQEMTAAFATFANQGLRMKPMYVTRITDRDGNVIEEARPRARTPSAPTPRTS
jgi:penicillin-binding protein 1A